MSDFFVNVHGERINPYATPSALNARPKTTRIDDGPKHKGFSVEGYAPGVLEAAQKTAEGNGLPWDEQAEIRRIKPQRVRSKPYEIPAAAEECAQLARRCGWRHVVVRALTK